MIVELLHKVAVTEHKEDENVFYPRPSLSGPERCSRQMVYWGGGKEPDSKIGGRMLHVFNDSSWHEELTAEWIAKTTFRLHSRQMYVETNDFGVRLGGKHDGIVTDLLEVDRLWEHKAINHFTFERCARGDSFPEDNLAQCAVYLRGLHAVQPECRECLLMVKNKNTASFLEYLLDYDFTTDCMTIVSLTHSDGSVKMFENEKRENIVQKVSEKFLGVLQHIKDGSLPDRPFDPGDWHCNYCKFQRSCWDGYAGELNSVAVGEGDLEGEIADRVRYYQELGGHIGDQEKEKKDIGKELLQHMLANGLKKGRAGEYMVTLMVLEKSGIEWKDVPPSVSDLLNPYRKKTPSSFVRVMPLKKAEKK